MTHGFVSDPATRCASWSYNLEGELSDARFRERPAETRPK